VRLADHALAHLPRGAAMKRAERKGTRK
jgi:hypothetical protein